MSLDDRLRAAAAPDPDFDSDGDLADIRRRASRIRRRRAAMTSGVLVLLVGIAATLWPDPSDRATIDTADTTTPWFLPTSVPDGYELAWVDLPPARTGDSGRADDPLVGTYAYGYQSPTAELDTRIAVGASLDDPDELAAMTADGGIVDEIDGRIAVRWASDGGTERLLVDLDGVVAYVIVHPRGATPADEPQLPASSLVDRYAASIERVFEGAWQDALESGADVADRYGPVGGRVVIESPRWQVFRGEFRAPFSVRMPAAWATVGNRGPSAVPVLDEPADHWTAEILAADGTRLAWGLAPTGSRTVRVVAGDQEHTESTLLIDGVRMWALELPEDADISDATVEFLGDSAVIASGPIRSADDGRPDADAAADPEAQAHSIARRLGCDSTADGTPYITPDEPQPVAALSCQIGDAGLNITVYAYERQVAAALEFANQFCGHRAFGRNWIVVTNTPETAERAAAVLGGTLLTLAGCTEN